MNSNVTIVQTEHVWIVETEEQGVVSGAFSNIIDAEEFAATLSEVKYLVLPEGMPYGLREVKDTDALEAWELSGIGGFRSGVQIALISTEG